MVEPGEVVDRSTRREVLALYGRATLVDPQSYRAWHQWGLSNYRAIEEARGSTGRIQSAGVSCSSMGRYVTRRFASPLLCRAIYYHTNTVF
jgi:FAT domain